MSINNHVQAISQVQVGEPINGAARQARVSAELADTSVEALKPGQGVCRRSSAIGNYRPLVELPTASNEFLGIVPQDAIPTDAQAAINGWTAGQVSPGKCFAAGAAHPEGAQWRVPLASGTSSEGAQAYLIYSGASAGDWATSDLGVQPVYLLSVTSTGANTIGFSATIGGVAGASLSVSSVSAAADAAALAAAWNANAYYASKGAAAVGGTDDVVVTGTNYQAITFTDTSTGANAIAPSTTTALVAPTARAIPGARFRMATVAPGSTTLELK